MDGNTPAGILHGRQAESCLDLATRILLRYTKAEAGSLCRVALVNNGKESIIQVMNDITEAEVEQYRIDMK
jgi:hypothetical protein